MCTGLEVALIAGSVVSAAGAAGAFSSTPKTPDVVQQNPLADQNAIDTQAAQEAQAATLEARRRGRANSLLSAAGGTGDPVDTSTVTQAGAAVPKTTLGA